MWPDHSSYYGATTKLDLKRYYLALIVYHVINNDGLTKREICNLTDFSWGLISRSVNELTARGYFDRLPIRKKPGSGRNAFDYTISGKRFSTIGLAIEGDRILGCALTLKREPIAFYEIKNTAQTPDQLVEALFSLADKLLGDCGKINHQTIGIGISVQGIVDVIGGKIVRVEGMKAVGESPFPSWIS